MLLKKIFVYVDFKKYKQFKSPHFSPQLECTFFPTQPLTTINAADLLAANYQCLSFINQSFYQRKKNKRSGVKRKRK